MSKDEDKSRQAANEQLLPCPFCGHSAVIREHRFFSETSYGVVCDSCGAMSFQFYPTMGEAVAAWNERIENRSSANVAPVVRGEWKWNDDNGYYYCSECGAVSPREDQDGEYIDCPHYCHNCGADMREHPETDMTTAKYALPRIDFEERSED